MDRGITVVEGFDYEIIEKKYCPNDNYSILVTLKSDGKIEKTVVGSIGESCILDSNDETECGRLKEIFAKDSLQFATFTITEKGYSLVNASGETLPAVKADFEAGPEKTHSYIGKVAALLYHRYLAGKKPIAMVSTDNCSHNGDKQIDVYPFWTDQAIMEIELSNPNEEIRFPDIIKVLREVTEDEQYKNASLAKI